MNSRGVPRLLAKALTLLVLTSPIAATTIIVPAGPATAGPISADSPSPVAESDHGAGSATGGVLDDGIRTVSFNDGWRFALVNPSDTTDPTGAYASAMEPTFDDTAWRSVRLPHDWSIERDPLPAAPQSGTSSGTGFFEGGLGWYRKTFTLPQSATGRRVSLEFDGIYMDSQVYVNGQLAASHPYGYTGFEVDLTGRVSTDASTPNVVAVKVSNKLPSSRWYSGSGIYRNTHLRVTDMVHIGRWGTFVTAPALADTIGDGYADVRIASTVDNGSGDAQQVTISHAFVDAGGTVVARHETDASVGNAGGTYVDTVRVSRPRLWSVGDPYRYTVRTQVSIDGRVVDTYLTRFGLRYVHADPQQGFSLNGQYLKIQGVDLHHDLGALGAAVNRDAILRQMTLMKSMGVNALRTSHNPPAPELIDVCEELGIIMLVEAFDTWRTPKTTYDYGRFFDVNSDSDITEMVNAAKNSPAVVMWSIGNEIPDSTRTLGLQIARRLVADIRAVDTTRPVIIGSDKYRGLPSPGSATDLIVGELDGIGLNYNTAQSVDALHARYPDKVLFESESSSETSTRGTYQDPELVNTGEDYTPGHRATSSYDNNLASWTMSGEYGLKKDRDRRYFLGQFLWSGIDYLGEPTPYSDSRDFPVKASFFGAVDTAGFPKDMYYLFKSQWTTDPMVHLLPMDWTRHQPGDMVDVWAYSNVDTVQLYLNGRPLGARTFDHKVTTDGRPYLETTEPSFDDKNYPSGSYTSPNGSTGRLHLTWRVPFEPGTLTAVATRDGVEVTRDVVRTAGAPYALRLTPDRHTIRADGTSLSFVTVDVVDRDGVEVPGAEPAIRFAVIGGVLAGLDNGRQESAENYHAASRSAFNGKALAILRSTMAAGPVSLTARAAGLRPGTTTVYAVTPGSTGLAGVPPVVRRIPTHETLRLPATVAVVSADGSIANRPVRWRPTPRDATNHPGTFTVRGEVAGVRPQATASVTVYADQAVDPVSTVVPVGVSPTLPGTVRLVFTDGEEDSRSVRWQAIPASRYAGAGTFTVRGDVAGSRLRAVATVRVTADTTPGVDLAQAGGPTRPSADASYSGSRDAVPAALLDGLTATGGWSNYYLKQGTALLPAVSSARAADWVAVSWPAAQTFDTLTAYFATLDGRYARPSTLAVRYWNGTTWQPVGGLSVAWATETRTATTITFDRVNTTRIRLELTSPAPGTTTGFLQVAELDVIGTAVASDP